MQANDRLTKILTLLAKRNEHLAAIQATMDKELRTHTENEHKRAERMVKHLTVDKRGQEGALDKLQLVLELKEKINRALHNSDSMKDYFYESVFKKEKRKKTEWALKLDDNIKKMKSIDERYLSHTKEALSAFLGKENIENITVDDLDAYCINPNYLKSEVTSESKTGLMFALATLGSELTPDYLFNMAAITLPKPTTQKKTIEQLQETMPHLNPLIQKYNEEKKSNPVKAIAALIENLRGYFVILNQNKQTGEVNTFVNNHGLRALYNRECTAAGITPAKIGDFEINAQSILTAQAQARANANAHAHVNGNGNGNGDSPKTSPLEKMSMFSPSKKSPPTSPAPQKNKPGEIQGPKK